MRSLLISSIIIILSYITATIAYNVGLSMLGTTPTARAGNNTWERHLERELVQYGKFINDPNSGDYKNFEHWQSKRIFKYTISELEER
jgi:hypothetical protein